ncbi:MAG: hypothetical protein ACE5H3_05080 [Planctomycetota bacterium]
MTPLLFGMLALFQAGAPPADARAFLSWYGRIALESPHFADQAEQARAFLGAGAFDAARQAARRMEALQPGDRSAAFFRFSADAFDPTRVEEALAEGRALLADPSGLPSDLVRRIQNDLAFLQAESQRRAEVRSAETQARLAPLGGLLLLLLFGAGLWRGTLPKP